MFVSLQIYGRMVACLCWLGMVPRQQKSRELLKQLPAELHSGFRQNAVLDCRHSTATATFDERVVAMQCPNCGENGHKFGKTRLGQQRYRCLQCDRTFSEPRPLAGMSTPIGKVAQVLSMLLEGMSIRATCRLTGADKSTVLRVIVQAGKQCQRFMAETVWNHPFEDLQIDEQWSFVRMKEKTAQAIGAGEGVGDAYAYLAIDRDTKFIACFHIGRRDSDETWRFVEKLYRCVSGRPQISTDGFGPYHQAIPLTWRHDCDYAQIVKQYGSPDQKEQRRYSPAHIIGVERKTVCGSPDKSRISTSHIERQNLNNRMHNRRFTRLTNAFSKKWENHEAMFALYIAWYNFCRPHMTLKTTPAVAAGFAKQRWTLERLLRESALIPAGE